jgi:competence protein ComEA
MGKHHFGFRNAEFGIYEKIKILFSIFYSAIGNPHSVKSLLSFHIPHSALRIPHFSMGQQKVLFLLALFILAVLYFKFYFHPLSRPSEEVFREIVIEVVGEVNKPGIYIFKNAPTLKEVIEKAGGFNEPILLDTATSSEVLETGTLLNVLKASPKEIKLKIGRMEANKLLTFSIPLDLNRVSIEDLCLIPGIGESLAREIVTYRQRRKGFRSVEELKNVKGVGKEKYQSYKPFFTVK